MSAKYTLEEIDRMRRLVENEFLWGHYGGPSSEDLCRSRAYKENELTTYVEERVRTLMTAGIRPSDMEKPE